MKNLSSLIFSCFLAITPLVAQTPESTQVSTSDSTTVVVTESPDTATLLATETNKIAEDITEASGDFIRGMEDGGMEEYMIREHMGYIVCIIALIFGIPCLLILTALIVILVYALKRNQRRNAIINNAIEHNYQLPEAFYTGQKANTQNGNYRNPKKFYSSVTLIAIGFSVIIFAIAEEIPFFLLCGGTPLLIGVGKMIGFFCITTPSPTTQLHQNHQNNNSYPSRPPQAPQHPLSAPIPPQAPQTPQTPLSSPTPPPYNPNK